jgi:hypothetical protein
MLVAVNIRLHGKDNDDFDYVHIVITGALGTELPPPPFSNFLITYLFSIKFLYSAMTMESHLKKVNVCIRMVLVVMIVW